MIINFLKDTFLFDKEDWIFYKPILKFLFFGVLYFIAYSRFGMWGLAAALAVPYILNNSNK